MISDLRDRRLWPVAAVLLAAIVAVPLVLAKPAPPTAATIVADPLAAAAAPAWVRSLPAITVETALGHHHLGGLVRDPFASQTTATTTTATGSAHSASGGAKAGGGSTQGTTTSTSTGGSTGSTTTSTTSTTSSPTSTTTTTSTSTTAIPAGLGPRQAYHVTLAYTTPDDAT